jgi:hypothetical protein
MIIIEIFMTKDPATIPSEYHQVIVYCRLHLVYLWNKLCKIQHEF